MALGLSAFWDLLVVGSSSLHKNSPLVVKVYFGNMKSTIQYEGDSNGNVKTAMSV